MIRYIIALLFLSAGIRAQIVNIESLRLENDSSGFSGQENFSFKITENTSRLLELTNNLALQYRKKEHIILFLNNFSYTFSEETDYENDGFFHLRYNYVQSKLLTYEAFGQYQSDIPLRIERRILIGAGPRFTFIKKEKISFVAAALAMYEADHELGNDIEHYNTRLSSYISAGFKSAGFTINTLIYYQPRVDMWKDFRISGQWEINIKLWRSLFFTSIASLNYDAFPVADPEIPKLTYKLTNGITYRF